MILEGSGFEGFQVVFAPCTARFRARVIRVASEVM